MFHSFVSHLFSQYIVLVRVNMCRCVIKCVSFPKLGMAVCVVCFFFVCEFREALFVTLPYIYNFHRRVILNLLYVLIEKFI